MSFGGHYEFICQRLYWQNNLTNEFMDLKLVEKEELVKILG